MVKMWFKSDIFYVIFLIISCFSSLNATQDNFDNNKSNFSSNAIETPNPLDIPLETFLNENNISFTKDDNIYFISILVNNENVMEQLWVNMSNENTKILIWFDSYRRASTIELSFDFPCLEDVLSRITITSGFLYTGYDILSSLPGTEYIAPLMANFDTSLGNDSHVKYLDNGTALTVEWENLRLQDNPEAGKFTFQTTLLDNGDIIFVYKFLPILVENIQDIKHPVKIGVSGAYHDSKRNKNNFVNTVQEYYKVDFKKEDIKNGTVIYLSSLPICSSSKDCAICLSNKLKKFQCSWCPKTKECSNAYRRSIDFFWYYKSCNLPLINDSSLCPLDADTYYANRRRLHINPL